jgi:hypothetical protein
LPKRICDVAAEALENIGTEEALAAAADARAKGLLDEDNKD